ncbi:hypothetical protein [Limobrevibacterium gyesilva]|uniref:hypothetical protein n=1 Tax=Limobrevibacterium gyesilva TaxID=2991712 RepID=UPI002227609F|nr:hypothetical protein [Limobrevibacterium gyesilva]
MAGGISSSFTQTNVKLPCTVLCSFPIIPAVATSNGIPVLFMPMTLISFLLVHLGIVLEFSTHVRRRERCEPTGPKVGTWIMGP